MSLATIRTHQKATFAKNVQDLVGSPNRALLPALCSRYNKKGDVVYIDAMGPDLTNGPASDVALTTSNTRREIEQGTVGIDEWLAIQTPHMEVTRQRTLVTPRLIEWGHSFSTEQQIQELEDPTSATLRSGMSTIFYAEDARVISAFDATVTRQTGGTADPTNTSTAFDTTHQTTIDATGGGNVFDLDDIGAIVKMFEDQYAAGEAIFLVMSPARKWELIATSGGTIQSSDFVTPQGYFERGELPDIYGVHIIVQPQLATASGVDEYMYAWTPFGMAWNQFKPLTSQLDVVPAQRFNALAYLSEYANAARIDDGRVVRVLYDKTA